MESKDDDSFPRQGRLLGIDFGTVRTGIAICDASQSIASPLKTYTRRNEKLDTEFFVELVHLEQVAGLVVGLPLHLSGDESEKSMEARAFGNFLAKATGLPVCWIDERFSTALARELLTAGNFSARKKKERLDMVAAQAILTAYLESPPGSRQSAGPIDH